MPSIASSPNAHNSLETTGQLAFGHIEKAIATSNAGAIEKRPDE
jgi:hypothetical protein